MSRLFESGKINRMETANRFVRSATWEGLAGEDGAAAPELIETMTRLADGGVGLIITGHAYVSLEGQATPRQLGIYKDELVSGLREMTEAVHRRGGKIVAQLAHAGNFAAERLTGAPPWVVSDFEGLARTPRRELSETDIKRIVTAFGAASERAVSAGFDGLQLHAAHGYLLSQFLSPFFNRRKDDYGGAIQNRVRIHLEICREVRKTVGNDYPMLIKMNCRDFTQTGLSLEDAVEAGKRLAEAGIDAIEVSGGLLTEAKLSPSRPGIDSEEKEAYFREEARSFRKEIGIPIILVGGIRSFEVAERVVTDGTADFVSMSRPLIREPGLIHRWKSGDRRKADCKSDNLCFRPGFTGEGVYCATGKRGKREN